MLLHVEVLLLLLLLVVVKKLLWVVSEAHFVRFK